MASEQNPKWQMPTPLQAGLRNRCPRCGKGKLLVGLLSVEPACSYCELDYGFADAGDGPAVFVILIIGFVVTGLALSFQSAYAPPLWVHLVLWTPVVIGLSIWSLRIAKAFMIALQYTTKAREGVLE